LFFNNTYILTVYKNIAKLFLLSLKLLSIYGLLKKKKKKKKKSTAQLSVTQLRQKEKYWFIFTSDVIFKCQILKVVM
jgi:hypothetical protein